MKLKTYSISFGVILKSHLGHFSPLTPHLIPLKLISHLIPLKMMNPLHLPKNPLLTPPKKKEEKHRIAGTSFREKDIKDLMGENVAYDWSKKELIEDGRIEERIYKLDSYCGLAVLEPEPDNPNDPKAIKVLTSGIHIGYIKAGSCAHIHKVLREGRIEKAEVEIKGGAYKVILEEYDDYTDKSTYSIVKDTIPISAVLTLTIKQ